MGKDFESIGNKGIVDSYYQAGVEGRLPDFAVHLHPNFTTTAPNYLPWGGTHSSAAFFRDEVLPSLPDVLDFERFNYEAFFAEGEHVVALINIGVTGLDAMIKISEHWTLQKARPPRFGLPTSSRRRCLTNLAWLTGFADEPEQFKAAARTGYPRTMAQIYAPHRRRKARHPLWLQQKI